MSRRRRAQSSSGHPRWPPLQLDLISPTRPAAGGPRNTGIDSNSPRCETLHPSRNVSINWGKLATSRPHESSDIRKGVNYLRHGRILLLAASLLAASLTPPRMPAAVFGSDLRGTEPADYKTHYKMPSYQSRKQWEIRRHELQQQVLSAAGLLPLPAKTPLHPRVVRHLEYEDYAIEVILLETLPGYFLGGNLYLPLRQRSSVPAVLIPHGHW